MTVSATSPAQAASPDRRLLLALGGVGALAILAFWDLVHYESYRKMAERMQGADEFFFSPTGASPGFVLGIAAYLLYHRHRIFVAGMARPGRLVVAVPLFGLSLASMAWGQYTGAQHLLVCALASFLLGAAEAVGGAKATRAVLPSALLTLLLVPAPPTVFNSIMYELQLTIAAATAHLVSFVGIDSFQAGAQIVTERGVFQVIESCAGLRITETLLATAPLYAVLFHRSDSRMLALVAIAPVVGMISNELRVISLVLTPFSYFHEVHLIQGLIFLVIGVLGIAAFDGALERRGVLVRVPVRVPVREESTSPSRSLVGSRVLLCAGLALSLVLARFLVPAWEPDVPSPSVQRLRSSLKGIPSSGEKIDRLFLGSVRYEDRLYRRYEFEGAAIGLFVAVDDRENLGRSPYSVKTDLAIPGWNIERSWERAAPEGELERSLLIRSGLGDERRLVVVRYGGIASAATETIRYALALERTPWRRSEPAWAVRLDVAVDADDASIEEALRKLDAFYQQIQPRLNEVGVLASP